MKYLTIDRQYLLAYVLALAAVLVAMILPAHAQDVGIDLGWLVDSIAPLIAAVVAALVGMVVTKVMNWLNLKIEAQHRDAINQALDRAVQFAVNKGGDALKKHAVIDTSNPLVITAAAYAQSAVPAALRKFNITEDRLKELVIARLGDKIA